MDTTTIIKKEFSNEVDEILGFVESLNYEEQHDLFVFIQGIKTAKDFGKHE